MEHCLVQRGGCLQSKSQTNRRYQRENIWIDWLIFGWMDGCALQSMYGQSSLGIVHTSTKNPPYASSLSNCFVQTILVFSSFTFVAWNRSVDQWFGNPGLLRSSWRGLALQPVSRSYQMYMVRSCQMYMVRSYQIYLVRYKVYFQNFPKPSGQA